MSYAKTTQSRNLRVIESTLDPQYKAKNDTVELNTDFEVTPTLTLTSQTGFNQDFLWSTEDYNRFNTAPGVFVYEPTLEQAQLGSSFKIRTRGKMVSPVEIWACSAILSSDVAIDWSLKICRRNALGS